MLYRIQDDGNQTGFLERHNATTLSRLDGGYREADLQQWLLHHLDSVIRTDELMPIQQATAGEEADIMAVDASGRLFIFELKRWESRSENLLQVMRYAQLHSHSGYRALNTLYQRFSKTQDALKKVHQDMFGLDKPLEDHEWNHDQVLVVVTNGLDFETRQAIKYWAEKGLDIRAWVYRVYSINGQPFLDINAFGQQDDPFEDRKVRYHLVNTNYTNDPASHEYMLSEHRAAAFAHWKYKIDNIEKGDWVFLYRSGKGIVACGQCRSEAPVVKAPPHTPHKPGEEHHVFLDPFIVLDKPMSAAGLRECAGYHVPLVSTYTSVRSVPGEALVKRIKSLSSDGRE